MYGDWIQWVSPYLYTYEKIKFGKYADMTAKKGIDSTTLHSDNDEVISLDSSIYNLYSESEKGNIHTLLIMDQAVMN